MADFIILIGKKSATCAGPLSTTGEPWQAFVLLVTLPGSMKDNLHHGTAAPVP